MRFLTIKSPVLVLFFIKNDQKLATFLPPDVSLYAAEAARDAALAGATNASKAALQAEQQEMASAAKAAQRSAIEATKACSKLTLDFGF